MIMKIIAKYYEVFDIAYRTLEQAQKIHDGWEHKEPMYDRYVYVEAENMPESFNPLDNEYINDRRYENVKEEVEYLISEGIKC